MYTLIVKTKEHSQQIVCEDDKLQESLENISKGTIFWTENKEKGYWINPSQIVCIEIISEQKQKEMDKENIEPPKYPVNENNEAVATYDTLVDKSALAHQQNLCEE